MSGSFLTKRAILPLWFGCCLLLPGDDLLAGDYLDSAHGSSTTGVFRPVIGNTPPSGLGYSRGNCTHCHEQHASIGGNEQPPINGNASTYELFAPNFDISRRTSPYAESDTFCFNCHSNPNSAQSVQNNDYSQNFGCAPQGASTIMSAMDQRSYHNLYDVWTFSKGQFPWFTSYSNPCNACHNPHLAKRNWANAQNPVHSAISKPTDHFKLWGATETMGSSYHTKYEPPYCSNNLTNREPATSAGALEGRAATPDYVAFCMTCHSTTNTIFSTSLNRNIRTIDWSSSGDKHGQRIMEGSVSTRPPYDSPPSGTDLVLSCLDCHEPHGSNNILLLRRRVNGADLGGIISSFDTAEAGLLCAKCHKDDQTAGVGNANSWEYVHHLVVDAPYLKNGCADCHITATGKESIPCRDCHFHGSSASKADINGVFRRSF
jgi:hypothetical protein